MYKLFQKTVCRRGKHFMQHETMILTNNWVFSVSTPTCRHSLVSTRPVLKACSPKMSRIHQNKRKQRSSVQREFSQRNTPLKTSTDTTERNFFVAFFLNWFSSLYAKQKTTIKLVVFQRFAYNSSTTDCQCWHKTTVFSVKYLHT